MKDQKEDDDETKQSVIDPIFDHEINNSRKHRYVKQGENLYRVHWYG